MLTRDSISGLVCLAISLAMLVMTLGLPPAEMVRCSASRADVRRALGETATHEIGVYAFAVLGEPGAGPATPPAALGC